MTLTNDSAGVAQDIAAQFSGFRDAGLSLQEREHIGDLAPHGTKTISVPVTATSSALTQDVQVRVRISVASTVLPQETLQLIQLRNPLRDEEKRWQEVERGYKQGSREPLAKDWQQVLHEP